MSDLDFGEYTQYGFTWGPMEVSRRSSMTRRAGEGLSRALGVKTPYHDLDVYVSPTGRSVRVFRDGKELK